jgi:threonine synthase
MVKAFHEGREFAEAWPQATTVADGLWVPAAVGDFLILRALRESGGTALAVPDSEMVEAARLMGRTEGIFACPEGAATLVAFQRLLEQGWIEEGERVVLFNAGSGLKYAHLWA